MAVHLAGRGVTPLLGLTNIVLPGGLLLWPGKPAPAPPFTPVTAPDGLGRRWIPVAGAVAALTVATLFVDPFQPASCSTAKADCARFGLAGRVYAASLLTRANRAIDKRSFKALPSIERALWLRPNFSFAWNSRGIVHAAMGDHRTALADYDRALALRPSYLTARANRGVSLLALGEREQASRDFQAVYAASPANRDRAHLLPYIEQVLRGSRTEG